MIRNLLNKILKLLIKSGALGKIVKITYRGPGVSLNKFYSQGHWSTRHNIKRKYRQIFDKLFETSSLKWMEKFSIIIFYNSRHDVDNVVGMEKVFVDALKHEEKDGEVIRYGYIHDDSKKYYKGMSIFPDETLPIDTFEFILIEHK